MHVVPAAVDPLAELARLSRPAGPWLHLLDGAPSDARQLGWMLGQHGVVVRILRGHCLRTSYGLFDEAAAALQLPGDPVEDWPAFAGLLTDVSWLPGEGHVLVVTRAALLLAAAPLQELAGFVGAVREVARGRAEEGDPVPFHVVLQDDATGLAMLRPRLDVVGSRYDALSGWDAEEPVADSAIGHRTSYQPGDPRPDQVDRAVVTAVSTWDGLVEVRRCYEVFGGLGGAPVRVYSPVLAAAGPTPLDLAATVAAAAASAGAACLVLPLPAGASPGDPGLQAVAEASVAVWPEPPQPVEGPSTGDEPAAAPPLVAVDDATEAAIPGDLPVAAVEPEPQPVAATEASEVDAPRDDPAGGFELVAANLEWPFEPGSTGLDAVDAALVRHAGTSERIVSLCRTWVADPAGGWVRVVMAYVGTGSIVDVETERSTIVDIAQRSGAKRCCIEIVGVADIGDVHRWLEDRSVSLWRAVPAARPGRVPAEEPAQVASDLPDGGAQGQPAAQGTPNPAAPASPGVPAPAAAPSEQDARAGRSAPSDPAQAEQPGPDRPDRSTLAASATPIRPEPDGGLAPTDAGTTATPASPTSAGLGTAAGSGTAMAPGTAASPAGTGTASAASAGGGAVPARPLDPAVGLPLDATFEPGPGDDEAAARLVGWASERPGVLGVVTARTRIDGAQVVVVGVVVDADADADQVAVRAEAAGVLGEAPVPYLVESFCPTRGLAPPQLRLYRSSTRLWTRKVERAPSGPREFVVDKSFTGMNSSVEKVYEAAESAGDEQLPGGVTLVALDLDVTVERGPEEPDGWDAAAVAWIREQPHALAALRAETTADNRPLRVYTVLVDSEAEHGEIRRGLAGAAGAAGADRCAVEAFCPFDTISVFHVHLYGSSLSLWKTDRPRPGPGATDQPAEQGAAGAEPTAST